MDSANVLYSNRENTVSSAVTDHRRIFAG